MNSFWENIKKTFKEGTEIAEEYAQSGRIKIEIINIKRKIEKHFSELGEKTYNIISEKPNSNLMEEKEITELIQKIKSLMEELNSKNEELKKIGLEK